MIRTTKIIRYKDLTEKERREFTDRFYRCWRKLFNLGDSPAYWWDDMVHGFGYPWEYDPEGVKSIRKGVQDSCMQEIHRQLMYKCNNYIKVDRFFPSSKTCSHCGNIKADLSLSDRTYHCHACGTTIDRDMNAALNLLKEGLSKLSTVGHTVKDCGASTKDFR